MVAEIDRLPEGEREPRRRVRGRAPGASCRGSARTSPGSERLDGRIAQAMVSIQAIKGVSIGPAWEVAGEPGLRGPRRDLPRARARLLPRDEPRRRHRGRDDERRAAGRPGRDEADLDPDEAAALGRRPHQGAAGGPQGAHRLDRRPGRRRRRRGDAGARPRPRLPREVRRRPHRRRAAPRSTAYRGSALPAESALRSSSSASWAPASRRPRARRRGVLGAEYVDTDRPRSRPRSPAADRRLLPRARARRRSASSRSASCSRRSSGRAPSSRSAAARSRASGSARRSPATSPPGAGSRSEVAWERCSGTDRPLARDRDGFQRRYAPRLPLYERVRAASSCLTAASGPAPPRLPWLDLLPRRPPACGMYWARSRSGEYPALVGPGATSCSTSGPAALRPGPACSASPT